jgi:dephospho-CoA kinase
MKSRVYITNGMGGCGKDTFADFMKQMVPYVIKISSIDRIKTIAGMCGWNGGKTEKDRKFLSDLKVLTSEYSDLAFNYLKSWVNQTQRDDYMFRVLLIDIREPDEIERAKNEFGAKTILITNDRIEPILSNMADANVFEYTYDYTIDNSGSFEDFEANIRIFAEEEGLCTSENLVEG